jgi:outer membrane protein assembly factor BamB
LGVKVNRTAGPVKHFVDLTKRSPRVRRMQRILVLLLAALLSVSAGCSSGDDDGDASESGAPARETTTTEAEPEPLDDQSPPASINGITVDGNTIWIASIEADEVLQVRRQDGAILARFPTDGAKPDDVAVAPDGSVWSTGFGNGDVGRIADGSYEVVTTIVAGINPIDIADDGTVFIGTYGPDGTLYTLETDGGAPSDRTEARIVAEPVPDINGFEVGDDDGTVIAPAGGIAGPGSVVAIDSGGEITTVADGLPGVAALAATADGELFVLANATGELFLVDREAGTAEPERTITEGAPFDNLSFADDGTLYLSSFTSPSITEVAPDGTTRLIPIGA